MKVSLLTDTEARAKLKKLCNEAGGVGELAKTIGITISAVSQQLHGHKPIHGKVAEYMGLNIERETTIFYREVD